MTSGEHHHHDHDDDDDGRGHPPPGPPPPLDGRPAPLGHQREDAQRGGVRLVGAAAAALDGLRRRAPAGAVEVLHLALSAADGGGGEHDGHQVVRARPGGLTGGGDLEVVDVAVDGAVGRLDRRGCDRGDRHRRRRRPRGRGEAAGGDDDLRLRGGVVVGELEGARQVAAAVKVLEQRRRRGVGAEHHVVGRHADRRRTAAGPAAAAAQRRERRAARATAPTSAARAASSHPPRGDIGERRARPVAR